MESPATNYNSTIPQPRIIVPEYIGLPSSQYTGSKQRVVIRYKPLSKKRFDHQRCKVILDFPRLADVRAVTRRRYSRIHGGMRLDPERGQIGDRSGKEK